VRGLGKRLFNLRPYALAIGDDVICPEAKDAPALALHRCRAPRIGLDLEGVVVTVDLDDEFPGDAGEVGKVGTDGMLTAELGASHAAIAQKFPAYPLGATPIAAKLAGACRWLAHLSFSRTPLPR